MKKKITKTEWNSRMAKEAQELIASGKMPTFAELADAIASSPTAQKLLAMRLTERVIGQKN